MSSPRAQSPNDAVAVRYALATAFLWSTVATAFKIALARLDVAQLLFYATAVAVACLSLIVVVRGKARLIRGHAAGVYLRAAGLGLLNPVAYYLVLLAAYDRLPGQVA